MKQGAGVTVFAAYDSKPVFHQTLDLCQLFTMVGESCPISPGTQTIRTSQQIPDIVPSVSLASSLVPRLPSILGSYAGKAVEKAGKRGDETRLSCLLDTSFTSQVCVAWHSRYRIVHLSVCLCVCILLAQTRHIKFYTQLPQQSLPVVSRLNAHGRLQSQSFCSHIVQGTFSGNATAFNQGGPENELLCITFNVTL